MTDDKDAQMLPEDSGVQSIQQSHGEVPEQPQGVVLHPANRMQVAETATEAMNLKMFNTARDFEMGRYLVFSLERENAVLVQKVQGLEEALMRTKDDVARTAEEKGREISRLEREKLSLKERLKRTTLAAKVGGGLVTAGGLLIGIGFEYKEQQVLCVSLCSLGLGLLTWGAILIWHGEVEE